MAEQEEPLLNSGDTVEVVAGEYKGKKAKVISAYTNSISVELDMKEEDGSKPRTVLKHSEYKTAGN
ncbi:KOW motif domain-containing protein [Salipaludibacillus sp. CUR1]|uniref:KOW motif domain-containing protein n=1 Tax=Salipaludibacillus sp. CUR1 TaxID=2820003 RepID=UPI001E65CDDE|nr:KOW motif domain-containing protein [Salipaludibacillus sp. CUR1]MCE7791923.1 KOW motif domain-containing protein [Salipaludibacillus sp. CUR1]